MLAFRAHEGQLGKDGLPYVCHPLHVAEQMDDEVSTCVALLHDVVEDTDVTLADLMAAGMSTEVCEAVDLLTHRRDQPYADYVRAVAKNDVARRVKLADVEHNMDESRLDAASDDEGRVRRRAKYATALDILARA